MKNTQYPSQLGNAMTAAESLMLQALSKSTNVKPDPPALRTQPNETFSAALMVVTPPFYLFRKKIATSGRSAWPDWVLVQFVSLMVSMLCFAAVELAHPSIVPVLLPFIRHVLLTRTGVF
jgi:hypothetical protein